MPLINFSLSEEAHSIRTIFNKIIIPFEILWMVSIIVELGFKIQRGREGSMIFQKVWIRINYDRNNFKRGSVHLIFLLISFLKIKLKGPRLYPLIPKTPSLVSIEGHRKIFFFISKQSIARHHLQSTTATLFVWRKNNFIATLRFTHSLKQKMTLLTMTDAWRECITKSQLRILCVRISSGEIKTKEKN